MGARLKTAVPKVSGFSFQGSEVLISGVQGFWPWLLVSGYWLIFSVL
jgi:hypothetical protein